MITFNNNYKSEFETTKFSNTIEFCRNIKEPTHKFGKTNVGINVYDQKDNEFLKQNGIKIYGKSLVYVEVKNEDHLREDTWLNVCIQEFTNTKGESFRKLITQQQ